MPKRVARDGQRLAGVRARAREGVELLVYVAPVDVSHIAHMDRDGPWSRDLCQSGF